MFKKMDISIHGWDKNYFRFRKTDGHHMEFRFLFRFWQKHTYRHDILHLLAKFRSNRTISGGVMKSYRFYNMAAIEPENYFRLRFNDWIKLLPVLANGQPPYWNSISGFDFDICVINGMSFCICLPNFVVIGRSSAKLWRHIDFWRWRP